MWWIWYNLATYTGLAIFFSDSNFPRQSDWGDKKWKCLEVQIQKKGKCPVLKGWLLLVLISDPVSLLLYAAWKDGKDVIIYNYMQFFIYIYIYFMYLYMHHLYFFFFCDLTGTFTHF